MPEISGGIETVTRAYKAYDPYAKRKKFVMVFEWIGLVLGKVGNSEMPKK